jgi:hypothetical protein
VAALLVQAMLFVGFHMRTFASLPSLPVGLVVATVLFLAGCGWGWQVQRDRTDLCFLQATSWRWDFLEVAPPALWDLGGVETLLALAPVGHGAVEQLVVGWAVVVLRKMA